MNRVIIDSHNVTSDIISAMGEQYPYGYSDEDMIVFKNAKNEIVKAVEVTLKDTDYLIKISKQMIIHLDNYNDDIEEIDQIEGQLTEFD